MADGRLWMDGGKLTVVMYVCMYGGVDGISLSENERIDNTCNG